MRLRLTLLFLLLALPALGQFHARFTFADFVQNPQPTNRVHITPLWQYTISGTNFITRDRITYTNNASGSLVVSNMVYGGYRLEFPGRFAVTIFTNSFPTNIASGSLVEASEYAVSVYTNSDPNIVAYSQAQADSRFVNAAGDGMTGGLTNNSGFYGNGVGLTNVSGLSAGVTNQWRIDATNAATAATNTFGTIVTRSYAELQAANTNLDTRSWTNNTGIYGNGVGLTNVTGLGAGVTNSWQTNATAAAAAVTNSAVPWALYATNYGPIINYGRFLSTIPFMETNNWDLGTEPPFVLLCVGDSYMDDDLLALPFVLGQDFGVGRAFNASIAITTNGAANTYVTNGAYTELPHGTYGVITGSGAGTLLYEAAGSLGIDAKTITIFFEKGGGIFNVSNNIAGGTFTSYGNVDTAGSGWGWTNITLSSRGLARVRLSFVSGAACKIYGVLFNPRYGRDAIMAGFSLGSTSWATYTNASANSLSNITWAMSQSGNQPRLILVDETSDADTWSLAPQVLNPLLWGAGTNADIFVLTPPPQPESVDAANVIQIRRILDLGQTNQWPWVIFNKYLLLGSNSAMTNNGLSLAGNVHLLLHANRMVLETAFSISGLASCFDARRPFMVVNSSGNIKISNQYGTGSGTIAIEGQPGVAGQIVLRNPAFANSIGAGLYQDTSITRIQRATGSSAIDFVQSTGDATLSAGASTWSYLRSGSMVITNTARFLGTNTFEGSTNVVPGTVAAPVGWLNVTNNGHRYQLPLYQ